MFRFSGCKWVRYFLQLTCLFCIAHKLSPFSVVYFTIKAGKQRWLNPSQQDCGCGNRCLKVEENPHPDCDFPAQRQFWHIPVPVPVSSVQLPLKFHSITQNFHWYTIYWCLVGNGGMIHCLSLNSHLIPPFSTSSTSKTMCQGWNPKIPTSGVPFSPR